MGKTGLRYMSLNERYKYNKNMEQKTTQQTGISIHRALAELKTIAARIEKAILEFSPVGYRKGRNEIGALINKQYQPSVFENNVKSESQSINDLIKRRQSLKAAIVKSNSITTVKIGDREMTVAEAIDYRKVLEHKKILVTHLEKRFAAMNVSIETNNKRVDDDARMLAERTLSRDGEQPKPEDIKAHMVTYQDNNYFFLIDPLNVEQIVKEMKEEINTFETEIDAVLSESNATTRILA